MKSQKVMDTALGHFEALTQWKFKYKTKNANLRVEEAVCTISNPKNREKIQFPIILKNEIRNIDLLQFKTIKRQESDYLIIAQYISKPIREQLRNNKINYLESTGNCHIEKENVFIFIDSEKAGKIERSKNAERLRTESGMRFLYAVLLNPNLLTMPYREISKEAEVSLGNIKPIIDAMEREGFLKTISGRKALKDKVKLFEFWANQYSKTLRPKLLQKTLSFADKSFRLNWKNLEIKEGYWGGEPAANMLDKYLSPEIFVIFTPNSLHQLMKKYKLIPNETNGEILYMTPPFKNRPLPEVADPYLIYAELISSNDSRCLEAADRIRKKYIDPTF